MERNITEYENEYNKHSFEPYMVHYRRKKVLECIKKYRHSRMLEIGCGMEPLFCYLDDFEKYVVVEPGVGFYENALKLADGSDKIIAYNECFEATKELCQNEYDMIICSSLLHELPDPEEMLRNIYAVCSDETIVHINVPNARSFHRMLAKYMGLISDEHEMSKRNEALQQNQVYDMDSLNSLVSRHGFEVIESGSYFFKPFSHGQMIGMIDDSIIDTKVLDGLYDINELFSDYGSEIYVNLRKSR